MQNAVKFVMTSQILVPTYLSRLFSADLVKFFSAAIDEVRSVKFSQELPKKITYFVEILARVVLHLINFRKLPFNL